MTSARDLRAMVASLERCMHRVRSARGAGCDAESRSKARSSLEEDVADASGLLRVAKRTGLDTSRLTDKLDAAQKLLGQANLVVVDTLSDDGSRVDNRPNSPEPRHPASPTQSTRAKQAISGQSNDDAASVRSSVAARNAGEVKRREEEIRRREEDFKLKQEREAIEQEAKRRLDIIDL